MTNKIFLAFAMALLVGCQAGWDKNPRLEGLPPEVEQEPPAYMAPMRDAILIYSDSKYEFVEGQKDATVEFDVKVLQEDITDVEVEIPGLEDYLTGATQSYDPATGKMTIKWDVPEVFVRGVDSNEVSYDLVINTHTWSKDGTGITRPKEVRFTVMRRLERPEIVKVEKASGEAGAVTLKEDSRTSIKVTVRDPNASNGRVTVAPPVLLVEPSTNTSRKSGHHMMEVGTPAQDRNDPQLWTFTISIITTGLEITNNSATFYYDLRAYTPMGASDEKLRSAAYSGNFRVDTNIGDVAFTGGHRVNFREGGSNSVTVSFYDPKGEGKAVVDTAELQKTCSAKGAVCECVGYRDTQRCEIWWKPTAADADPRKEVRHVFKFKAYLEHKTTKEKSRELEFEQEVYVTAAF